jgi:pimeloyl-ACP methyl ester carboxylesterase
MKLGFVQSNNAEPHRIAVYQYGRHSDHAVILLHAFSHNAKFFHELAEYLANRNLYVIAIDMPGRGESEYLKNPRNYNYWLYIDDIFLVMNFFHLNNVSFFGSSMGGVTSLLFAEKYPKMVEKIIFNDIGIFIPSEESVKVGSFVGQNIYQETPALMRKRLIEELAESDLSESELENVFNIYTTKTENGFRLNYDEKIKEAFWFGKKQIKIPDLDFRENFQNLSKTNKELECFMVRGEISNIFSRQHFEEMKNYKNVKDSFEVPEKGHLPLFFNNNQKEIIARWLKN